MKIVHVAASAPYNDYWGYQDNLLPKYHAKLGHDVTMLTTNTKHENGEIIEIPCADYRLTDGVRVIRFKRKDYGNPILNNLTNRIEIFDTLKEIHPDFIFFHGLVSDSIYDVVKYKKSINPNCIIVQDNHLDCYNYVANVKGIRDHIIRLIQRHRVKKTIAYVTKVLGVTPLRKEYAEDYFQVPKDKSDVLIMGADDEAIPLKRKEIIRKQVRASEGIPKDCFLIVSGGKIDESKRTHLLMEAVKNLVNVKLLVFGSVLPDFEDEFRQTMNDNVKYIGWIPAERTYDYLLSADLLIFPGSHSVLWEQACACKVPCVFAQLKGMDHVNNGGNSSFLSTVTVNSIRDEISRLHFTDAYDKMKSIAESEATDIYLYSEIAKKSLEIGINA